MMSRARTGPESERGAAAALTVVVIGVLAACAVFAVDLGNVWQSKRQLRTATDAGVLAAAEGYAEGSDGCANPYTTANDADAVVTDCHNHSISGQAITDFGYASLSAESPVEYQFAGVFGLDSTMVESTTHALYGFPTGAAGLRPMGLCVDANPLLTAWLNLPDGPSGDSATIRVVYSKDQPDACGSEAPGNWGTLDLNGGSQSQSDTKQWVLDGYDDVVPLSPPAVPGDTGAFSPSLQEELGTLLGKEFALPVFDNVTGTGSNASFDVVAFVWVRLIEFKVTGSQADRYLDLQFLDREVIQGTCCGTGGIDTGVRAVRICSVDALEHPSACSLSDEG